MTGHEILTLIAPPIELIEHLEKYQVKAQLPANVTVWLELWRTIRSDGKSPIDGVTAVQWATVAKRVAA